MTKLRLTLLATVAAAGPILTENAAGYQVFELGDSTAGFAFVLMSAEKGDVPQLMALKGDTMTGFTVVGLAEADSAGILFSEAEVYADGRIVDLDSSYIESDGQWLALPLVETMSLIAAAGLVKTTAYTVNKTTAGAAELRAARSASGVTPVAKVALGPKLFGVWQEGHEMVVAELTRMTASDYQVTVVGKMPASLALAQVRALTATDTEVA